MNSSFSNYGDCHIFPVQFNLLRTLCSFDYVISRRLTNAERSAPLSTSLWTIREGFPISSAKVQRRRQ